MASIDNLNTLVNDLVAAAIMAPDEATARNNLGELGRVVQGLADQLADRLRYGAYDIDGRIPPFRRGT